MASLYKALQIWVKRFSEYLAYEISHEPDSCRSVLYTLLLTFSKFWTFCIEWFAILFLMASQWKHRIVCNSEKGSHRVFLYTNNPFPKSKLMIDCDWDILLQHAPFTCSKNIINYKLRNTTCLYSRVNTGRFKSSFTKRLISLFLFRFRFQCKSYAFNIFKYFSCVCIVNYVPISGWIQAFIYTHCYCYKQQYQNKLDVDKIC